MHVVCAHLRASLQVIGCDRVTIRCNLLLLIRMQRSGCGASLSWLSVLHPVTLIPSSLYLCFPCKVWGFSKQTGGDKHMLWTALCWVVSEVQQSRPLSD